MEGQTKHQKMYNYQNWNLKQYKQYAKGFTEKVDNIKEHVSNIS